MAFICPELPEATAWSAMSMVSGGQREWQNM
jgi:hypothetical protein